MRNKKGHTRGVQDVVDELSDEDTIDARYQEEKIR
jgi:hypothetical protein